MTDDGEAAELSKLNAEIRDLSAQMTSAFSEAMSGPNRDEAKTQKAREIANKLAALQARQKELSKKLGVRSPAEEHAAIERKRALSLLDLLPKKTTIEIEGGELELSAITALQAARVIERYPQILKVLWGLKITPEEALSLPGAMAMAVAAACGHAEHKIWIEAAQNLSFGDQLRAVEVIIELSIAKDGFGPFVARLLALVGLIDPKSGREPDTGTPTSYATPTATHPSGASPSVN